MGDLPVVVNKQGTSQKRTKKWYVLFSVLKVKFELLRQITAKGANLINCLFSYI